MSVAGIKIRILNFLRKFFSLIIKIVPIPKVRDIILWPIAKRLFGSTGYSEIIEIRNGIKMRVYGDMQDMVNKLLLFTSSSMPLAWEPGTARLVEKIAPLSNCSIVAGSHIGYYPLILSKGNKSARIFAFEPNPINFKRCSDNIKLNGFSNITLVDFALGESSKKQKMYFDDGQSSLIDTNRNHGGVGDIQVVSLDSYMEDYGNSNGQQINPDLILLDAEGYEPFIISGASNIIKKYKPNLICEINPRALNSTGSSAESFCESLHLLGYKIFKIEEGDHGVRFVPDMKVKLLDYKQGMFDNVSFANIFATTSLNILDKIV